MTFQIDTTGTLLLRRAFGWTLAMCPLMPEKPCGDWCAMFGEPTVTSDMTTTLELCHRTLSCPTANFQDHRDHPKE